MKTIESKIGCWVLFTFVEGKETRIIPNTDPTVHTLFDTANDCDGEVLFDYMTEHKIIKEWKEYDTDGDNESVAIMHKTGDQPDYRWEFRANREPGPASDDCHTHS